MVYMYLTQNSKSLIGAHVPVTSKNSKFSYGVYNIVYSNGTCT